MNSWMLTGRLTKEPQTTGTQTGNIITVIYVAVRRDFKNKDTNPYKSDFYRFKAFGKTLANFIHLNLHKGDLVEINGRPQNNYLIFSTLLDIKNYEKDGEKVYRDDYIIRSISRLSAKREAQEEI